MRPAARVLDPTGHPGIISGPGVPNVLIGGMPAAVVGDTHACAFPPPASHPPTLCPAGSATVFISGRPALRVGDVSGCGSPIIAGFPSVLIGG